MKFLSLIYKFKNLGYTISKMMKFTEVKNVKEINDDDLFSVRDKQLEEEKEKNNITNKESKSETTVKKPRKSRTSKEQN